MTADTDPLETLREETNRYLLANKQVTQKALATLTQTTEQTICDFLGKRARGLKADTYARLNFIVSSGVVPKSNRIVSEQRFGRHVNSETVLDDPTMNQVREAYDQEHHDMINASAEARNVGTFATNHYTDETVYSAKELSKGA
jgi:hypothetical protein